MATITTEQMQKAEKHVDDSAEKYANRNIPRIGGAKLAISEKISRVLHSIGRAHLHAGAGRFEKRLSTLESKEEKARNKYNKRLAWANRVKPPLGAGANSARQRIYEKRLNDHRLKRYEDNLTYRQELTEAHKDARQGKIDSLYSKLADRQEAIDSSRDALKEKKYLALAKREIRRKKASLRRRGYSRSEAKAIVNDISGEQRLGIGKFVHDKIALKAAEGESKRELTAAQNRTEGLEEQVGRIQNKIKDDRAEADTLRAKIGKELGASDWHKLDQSALDVLLDNYEHSHGSLNMAFLDDMVGRHEELERSIVQERDHLRQARRALREAKLGPSDIDLQHEAVSKITTRRLGRLGFDLEKLWEEIEQG